MLYLVRLPGLNEAGPDMEMSRQTSLVVLLLPLVLAAETVDTAWVRRYDGPRHGQDWATCLAVDSWGNIYVAGPSAADTGYVNLDYVVIKYLPNGDIGWQRRYDFGGDDIPSSLGVDANGNVYVTGSGGGRTGTIKYDSIGRLVWLRTLGTAGYSNDLVLDGRGNALLCGQLQDSTVHFVTMKYRPNGETAWVRTYSGGEGDDRATAVIADGDGRVGTTGYGAGSGTHYDCTTVGYDSTGHRLWVARFDGPNHGDDRAYAMAVDRHGNVVVAGPGDNGYTTPFDYLTIKYSPKGETMWTRRYNGPANGWDEAVAVAVDGEGNVFVTGYTADSVTKDDYVTIKYDPLGNQVWLARYNSPYNNYDAAYDLAVDADGNAYVTGRSARGPTVPYDCLTVAYDPAGETLWAHRYDGPARGNDVARCVAVDAQGNVYVAGMSEGSGTGYDIVTIKCVQGGGVQESPLPEAARTVLLATPNQFRTSTTIRLPPVAGPRARLRVRDVTGRLVRTLEAGSYAPSAAGTVVWDGSDDAGCRLPPGIYTITASAGKARLAVKVTLLD